MRILVINPNTTASMTDKIGIAARAVASPGTEVVARNPVIGPVSIQGPEDGEAALPGLLYEIERSNVEDFDAVIIACFDDTGLYEARGRTARPVIGIGEAAFHAATLVASRFSVVTTLSVSVPVIEDNVRAYGFSLRCARVRASEVPVLELEREGSDACRTISLEIATALAKDDADAIVLGCAGMADLARQLSLEHGVPVIDGVAAAVKLAEMLHALGLQTSQAGPFRKVA
ncbi:MULTISPECIES: aspartate/glutamate racemase family protein [unclassified Rhizobium]|uniref:aspartate/glutamate racemase family protein n=1 Tax=unclassified Rhizobium TaxID=2613769 RepID=UPI001ADA5258|nr:MULTISPECIES: aspartate/glutamate racemase family protein [unclassified Rhizobium]MBO9099267.1 aspartate/glutamate racemase family protein [Rhizobium sp. L58/93]MBO9131927.1 aspartate/glutamate racemase family protein [Rhizobium sp. B209b/85]MBO9169529.1 aspartate/glutamate racemase family protein [Rhizobium sp. L245/93]MBO9185480.1 aspartate/glutamate racemase family protein [Rhizobium sp. E27B/91]QXZ85613.1 aspartate/glutamate racemase family protein [Rhizobium sp. K1/93]